jgi:hypothetical protein
MKTIIVNFQTYYLIKETALANGRSKLTLVPIHGSGIYRVNRNADGRYSEVEKVIGKKQSI